ncbi:DUF5677 domain-containing protein [Rhizorhabdus histidinilytica]
MSPVGSYEGWEAIERETLGFLLSATARASESALLLCAYGQLWDAEVLARSALEGTLKFAYLLQSPDTFTQRHTEYAINLFHIALMKDHLKCAELLAAVSDPDSLQWRPIKDRLLDDDELVELRATYDRVHRRELENRWGFTGLVSELSRSGDRLFRGLGPLPIPTLSPATFITWIWLEPRSRLIAIGDPPSAEKRYIKRTRRA